MPNFFLHAYGQPPCRPYVGACWFYVLRLVFCRTLMDVHPATERPPTVRVRKRRRRRWMRRLSAQVWAPSACTDARQRGSRVEGLFRPAASPHASARKHTKHARAWCLARVAALCESRRPGIPSVSSRGHERARVPRSVFHCSGTSGLGTVHCQHRGQPPRSLRDSCWSMWVADVER